MEQVDWNNILGWNEEQKQDIRACGYSYIRQGKYDIAIQFFKVLILLKRSTITDLRTLGALFLETGEFDQAVNYLNYARARDDSDIATRLNFAKALLRSGKTDDGLKLAQNLTSSTDALISRRAQALILAFSWIGSEFKPFILRHSAAIHFNNLNHCRMQIK